MMMMMLKSKMAINSIEIVLIKRWSNFKLFTELIVVLLIIDLVAGHTEQQQHHHHNNHVCNHQHPKAHDVSTQQSFFSFLNVKCC